MEKWKNFIKSSHRNDNMLCLVCVKMLITFYFIIEIFFIKIYCRGFKETKYTTYLLDILNVIVLYFKIT